MNGSSFEKLQLNNIEAKTAGFKEPIDEISQIPLPNQVPQQVKVNNYSNSTALNSLITQNEDLLTRLNVSIKLYAQLEDKLTFKEESLSNATKAQSLLRDQLLILKEKDKLITRKTQSVDGKISSLEEDIRLQETKYAELYSTSQDSIFNLKISLKKSNRDLIRYKKYRKNIHLISKSINRQLKEKTRVLRSTEQQKTQAYAKITELSALLKTQGESYKQKELDLETNFKQQSNLLKTTIENKSTQVLSLEGKLSELSETFERNIDLKNQLISEKRKSDERVNQSQKDLTQNQKELTHFRQEAKTKTAQIHTLNETVANLRNSNEEFKDSDLIKQEQIENLQVLWRESQQEIEKFKTQNDSLQKLNQQLCLKVNDSRRKTLELGAQLDQAETSSTQKIKNLKLKIDLKEKMSVNVVNSVPERTFAEEEAHTKALLLNTNNTNKNKLEAKKSTETANHQALSNIERLVAEIQSGFDYQESSEDEK